MRSPAARRIAATMLLALCGACAPLETGDKVELTLAPVSFASLPGWQEDRHAEALPALRRSCALRAGRNAAQDTQFGKAAEWRVACAAAKSLTDRSDSGVRAYFETWFRPYRVLGPDGERGLFTGYYEPELAGSRTRSAIYAAPLYARPDDLVMARLADFKPKSRQDRLVGRIVNGRLEPYFSRAEIDGGALVGRGLELYWAADPIAVFFLHIQGSGLIRLRDGTRVRLGYAAANGLPYTAIGRTLVRRRALKLEEVSLQSIRRWLMANPSEAPLVLAKNASYVFFRKVEGEGPLGAQGVPLTAGRSIAVDSRLVPLGLPIWLDVAHPLADAPPLRRLVVAQDTGAAIRGAVRGDLFWGAGKKAEALAGPMRSQGRYFALIPRKAPTPAGETLN